MLSDVGELWDTPLAPGAVLAAPQNRSVSVATLISSHIPAAIIMHFGAAASVRWRWLFVVVNAGGLRAHAAEDRTRV